MMGNHSLPEEEEPTGLHSQEQSCSNNNQTNTNAAAGSSDNLFFYDAFPSEDSKNPDAPREEFESESVVVEDHVTAADDAVLPGKSETLEINGEETVLEMGSPEINGGKGEEGKLEIQKVEINGEKGGLEVELEIEKPFEIKTLEFRAEDKEEVGNTDCRDVEERTNMEGVDVLERHGEEEKLESIDLGLYGLLTRERKEEAAEAEIVGINVDLGKEEKLEAGLLEEQEEEINPEHEFAIIDADSPEGVVELEEEEEENDEMDMTNYLEEVMMQRDKLLADTRALELLIQNMEERSTKDKQDLLLTIKEFSRKEEEQIREKEDLQSKIAEGINREKEMEKQITALSNQAGSLEKERNDRELLISDLSNSLHEGCNGVTKIISKLSLENTEVAVEDAEVKLGRVEASFPSDDHCDFTVEVMDGIKKFKRLISEVELRFGEYDEVKRKEKRELENSVLSLTEEARDMGSLLKVAVAEKEVLEKSLNKLKGGGGEPKRVAILQIAQRVGFGFMMGSNTAEGDLTGVSSGVKAEAANESTEEDGVNLVTAVESMMRNLRLEISKLRTSLEESRADNGRLQSLSEMQAERFAESSLYIRDLEERENLLTQNVEELMMAITEAEEDVARWREACELEVEAGKNAIEVYDKKTAALKEELEKTKELLDSLYSKLKLKEELAGHAMAAQEAAERSLKLADSRSLVLHERIEELTKQLEEAESSGNTSSLRKRVRRICWPWKVTRINPGSATPGNTQQRMLPDTEALLQDAG